MKLITFSQDDKNLISDHFLKKNYRWGYDACLLITYAENEKLENILESKHQPKDVALSETIFSQLLDLEVPYAIANIGDRYWPNILYSTATKQLISIDMCCGLFYPSSAENGKHFSYFGEPADDVICLFKDNKMTMETWNNVPKDYSFEKQILQCAEIEDYISDNTNQFAEFYSRMPANLIQRANILKGYLKKSLQ